MNFLLIAISLTLTVVAGVFFLYLMYLERIERSHKKYIRELEDQITELSRQLNESETKSPISADPHGLPDEDDIWADVIEESRF
jgi:hypothetical protein